MNLALWLSRTAAAMPERPALHLGRDVVADYRAFDAQAGAVAQWLQDKGVKPGDRVGIFMKNVPEFLVAFWGIWRVGAVVLPINAKLHGREAAWILEDSGANICFASPGEAAALREAGATAGVVELGQADWLACQSTPPRLAVEPRAPDDLAWLFYTSGTTGRPKGVMITHGMLAAMTMCYFTDVDTVTADDTALYAAPMSHGAGIYNLMHVYKGAAHVCPASGGFDEGEIFDLASHFGRVHMFAAPTMVVRMTRRAQEQGLSGEGLRTVVYAGGPMYVQDILEAQRVLGDVFVQVYGQGECPMAITALSRADVSDRSHPRWRERLGSVGRAQAAVEVQIGDETGRPLPIGEIGEVMVRGATVMPGYWQNEGATQKAILDGWLMTGDVGALDADGYVTLHDRSKDMIISGGSNVYPREVEEVLMLHELVDEVSVVGRPHAEWGEEVVAFVVGQASPDDLDRLCLAHIARFKRPKDYIQVEALPKNNYGKVLKTELRDRFK